MPVRRILVLAANPDIPRTRQLRLDEEAKRIRHALRGSDHRDQFSIESRGAVTIDELRRSLSEVRPAIVHFSGHGTTSGKLVLETATGDPWEVDPKALADLFRLFSQDIECVCLNACFSEDQAKGIVVGVPYVIGMTDAIGDAAAIRFSEIFYESLGNGYSYEESYEMTVTQLKIEIDPSTLSASLLRKSRIVEPREGDTLQVRFNPIRGVVERGFSGHLYLLTGGENRTYWPSARIDVNDKGQWLSRVHVGDFFPTATITLVSADDLTSDYIGFYRRHADKIGHKGLQLSRIQILDQIKVNVDLMPLRQRFVGSYDVIGEHNKPTGEIVDVTLSGEWGLQMVSSSGGTAMWESTVMIDGGNPDVGKGVYVLADGIKGHHQIKYNRSDKTIEVGGYNLERNRQWIGSYILRPRGT